MTTLSKTSQKADKPVWFITGCSTGFGRHIAKHVLELGYPTVVTARSPDEVRDLAALGDALVLKLDVTDRDEAEAAVKAAEEHYGHIDVLVNNAGIGYFAAVEESDETEVRKMFDVNVFGLCRMIHVVRKRWIHLMSSTTATGISEHTPITPHSDALSGTVRRAICKGGR